MTKLEFIKKMRKFGWDAEYVRETIQNVEDAAKQGINIPYEIFVHKFAIREIPIFDVPLEEWRRKKKEYHKKQEKEFDKLEAMYADDKGKTKFIK